MADEIIKININFTGQQEKLLEIPKEIKAPRNSIIQWNIIDFNKYWVSPLRLRPLVFTIYFSNNSPFRWKRQFIQLNNSDPRFLPNNTYKTLRLAEDVAEENGEFKYGIKVENPEVDETIFDEDPYLIIF